MFASIFSFQIQSIDECFLHVLWISDDDSDVDEVTDYLSSNTNAPDGIRTGDAFDKTSPESNANKKTKPSASPVNTRSAQPPPPQNSQSSNHQMHNHHINNNMVPTISVTPHSPGAKFNNILGERKKKCTRPNKISLSHCSFAEDTLNQLQHIRESVVQMKNSSTNNHHHYCTVSGLINPAVSMRPLHTRFAVGPMLN